MGQTPRLSRGKPNHFDPKYNAPCPQTAMGRRKFAQHRRDPDIKSSIDTLDTSLYKVSISADEKGNVKLDSAASIPDRELDFVLGNTISRYRDFLYRRACADRGFSAVENDAQRPPYSARRYRRDGNLTSAAINRARSASRMLKHSNKRRRSSPEDGTIPVRDETGSHLTERSDSTEVPADQGNLLGIQIQDAEKLKEYLFDAFTSFQQINCRTLCKSWIRTIEPKKQVNHPYNGNLKVKGVQKAVSTELPVPKESDPEETKPRWWPAKGECPHKEPDHIKKGQRLALLCHILMNMEGSHECSTEDLKKAMESDKAKIKPPEKIDILTDIWKIGYTLERFKDGEIDGTSEVLVRPRKEEARMIRGGGRSKKASGAKEESEDDENSECPEADEEVTQTLTPTTPSALSSCRRQPEMNQASRAGVAHPTSNEYAQSRPDHQFQRQENRDSHHRGVVEYQTSDVASRKQGETTGHGSCGDVFTEDVFVEDSYGNPVAVGDQHDFFHPNDQPMLGPWDIATTSDLFSMQFNGDSGHMSGLDHANGDRMFDHYPYASPPKQPYRNDVHDFPADGHNPPPALYEDHVPRFQRVSSSSFSRPPTQGFHSGNGVRHHSCDLPSHIRA